MQVRNKKKSKYIESEDEDEEIFVAKKQIKKKSEKNLTSSSKPKKLKKKDSDDDDYQPNAKDEQEDDYHIPSQLIEEDDLQELNKASQYYSKSKGKQNRSASRKKPTQKKEQKEEENQDEFIENEMQYNQQFQGAEYYQNAEKCLPYFVQEGFVKDEEGREPQDPDYDPSTLHIPIQAFQKQSPMFKQYWNAKKKNYDSIVFFRFGRWRYTFYKDAIIVSQIFGYRFGFWGKDRPALTVYDSQYPIIVRGLLEKGIKVCVIEQTEKSELADKGEIAQREVSQLISKGTWQDDDEDQYGQQRQKNKIKYIFNQLRFLMSLIQEEAPRSSKNKYTFGIALVDATTNEFYIDQFQDDDHSNNLRSLIMRTKPVEIIVKTGKFDQEVEKMIKNLCNPIIIKHTKEYKPIYHIFQQFKKEFMENIQVNINDDQRDIYIPDEHIEADINNNINLNEGIYDEIQQNQGNMNEEPNVTLSMDYPELLQELEKQHKYEIAIQKQEGGQVEEEIQSYEKENFSYYYSCQALYMLQFYLRKLMLSDTVYRRGRFYLMDNVFHQKQSLYLDSQALESLEIFQANLQTKIQEKGSLFSYINHCGSAMGKRLLRKWLSQPLFDLQRLLERQNSVVDLVKNIDIAAHFHSHINNFPDIERAITKIFNSSQTSRLNAVSFSGETFAQSRLKELAKLLKVLGNCSKLLEPFKANQQNFSSRLRKLTTVKNSKEPIKAKKKSRKTLINDDEQVIQGLFPDVQVALTELEKCLHLNEQGEAIPMKGVNEEYDRSQKKVEEIHKQLTAELEHWKKYFNCRDIAWFHGRMRYQLEIPDRALEGTQKPKELIITSKKKGFQRFQSDKIEKILLQLRICEEEEHKNLIPFLQEYFQKFYSYKEIWYQLFSCLAELDCLCSLALTSSSMQVSCIPKFVQPDDDYDCSLQLEEAFHPCLLDSMKSVKWVPNSIHFSKDIDCLLLTGPNMSGKSTLLRLTAVSIILAQIGCFVPAKNFTLLPVDRIFCRIGASDRLLEGKSTFFIEMEETKTILEQCTSRSLVIIDELGRGTSTYDGVAIASSVLKYLTTKILPKTLFATHYHILLDEFALYKNIQNTVMKHFYDEEKEEVVFTYQLVEGSAEKSFAANVARLAGLPLNVVKRAKEIELQISKEEEKLTANRNAMQFFNKIIQTLLENKNQTNSKKK